MANPNINSPTNCYANNAQMSITALTDTQFIVNPASSGTVYLIDSIILTNVSAAAANVFVTIFNSTDATGVSAKLAHISGGLGPGATLVVTNKSHNINLKEGQSIYCRSNVINAVTCAAFWKEFS